MPNFNRSLLLVIAVLTISLAATGQSDQIRFELCKDVAAIIVKQIPGIKLISIKGAGHIMNMDKPGKFNKVILKFVRQIKKAE